MRNLTLTIIAAGDLQAAGLADADHDELEVESGSHLEPLGADLGAPDSQRFAQRHARPGPGLLALLDGLGGRHRGLSTPRKTAQTCAQPSQAYPVANMG